MCNYHHFSPLKLMCSELNNDFGNWELYHQLLMKYLH